MTCWNDWTTLESSRKSHDEYGIKCFELLQILTVDQTPAEAELSVTSESVINHLATKELLEPDWPPCQRILRGAWRTRSSVTRVLLTTKRHTEWSAITTAFTWTTSLIRMPTMPSLAAVLCHPAPGSAFAFQCRLSSHALLTRNTFPVLLQWSVCFKALRAESCHPAAPKISWRVYKADGKFQAYLTMPF